MQVKIDTIKTTAFILKYKLKGYKLLQNPKGTNPNEVVMMKNWFGIEPDYYDKHYHYNRIHRYKKNDKYVKDETLLLTEYFMDTDTKTYSGKRKNLNGYIIRDGEFKKIDKTNVSQNDLFNRRLPDWCDGNEEYDFGEELFKQNRSGGYYLPRPNLLARLFTLGSHGYRCLCGLDCCQPFRPSFLQILKSNLNGGGMA